LPSQVPSGPQVEAALFGHTSAVRGGSPAATKLQIPGAAVVPHDLQVSVQALLQQTPSTQNPLLQSAGPVQDVPLATLLEPSCRPPSMASRPASFIAGGGEDE
jgi:hypothetical protein